MTQTTESTEYPQDKHLPTEPMRCSNCGTLLGFYSDRSDADLLLRCAPFYFGFLFTHAPRGD